MSIKREGNKIEANYMLDLNKRRAKPQLYM